MGETGRDLFYKSIAENIRAMRKTAGATQGDLAEAVGLSRPSIANIEKGRQRILLDQFVAICDFFGVPPFEVLSSNITSPIRLIERLNARIYFLEGRISEIRAVSNQPIYKTPSALKSPAPNPQDGE